jgi:hypothetical protein
MTAVYARRSDAAEGTGTAQRAALRRSGRWRWRIASSGAAAFCRGQPLKREVAAPEEPPLAGDRQTGGNIACGCRVRGSDDVAKPRGVRLLSPACPKPAAPIVYGMGGARATPVTDHGDFQCNIF